jgi:hypothetical protein
MPVEDAIFEVVPQRSVALRQSNDNPAPMQQAPASAQGASVGRLAGVIERQLAKLSPQAFMLLISVLFAAMFWACGGFSHLGGAPAPAVTGARFALSNISVDAEDANGMRVVSVFGTIHNVSDQPQPLPRLTVVSGAQRRALGSVTLSADMLAAGASLGFSGRYKLAGGKLDDIAVIADQP